VHLSALFLEKFDKTKTTGSVSASGKRVILNGFHTEIDSNLRFINTCIEKHDKPHSTFHNSLFSVHWSWTQEENWRIRAAADAENGYVTTTSYA